MTYSHYGAKGTKGTNTVNFIEAVTKYDLPDLPDDPDEGDEVKEIVLFQFEGDNVHLGYASTQNAREYCNREDTHGSGWFVGTFAVGDLCGNTSQLTT